jgi:hypothetical protein
VEPVEEFEKKKPWQKKTPQKNKKQKKKKIEFLYFVFNVYSKI